MPYVTGAGRITSAIDEALLRASALTGKLTEEPRLNPATGKRTFALRDPDGYFVMLGDNG
jgi:hypothetical protein